MSGEALVAVLGVDPALYQMLWRREARAHRLLVKGRYDDAEASMLRVLDARERTQGLEHPDTLSTKGDIASIYASQGRYADALALHLRTLEAQERTLGPDHHDTLTSLNGLGWVYVAQGHA